MEPSILLHVTPNEFLWKQEVCPQSENSATCNDLITYKWFSLVLIPPPQVPVPPHLKIPGDSPASIYMQVFRKDNKRYL